MARGKVPPKESKRELLQEAALKVFLAKGFHQTRIEDIAARAGVGKGTFYLHFDSKEDLVHSLLDEFFAHFDRIHAWIFRAIEEKEDLLELFGKEGEVITELLGAHRSLGLFLIRHARTVGPKVASRVDLFLETQVEQAAKSYTRAKDLGLLRDVDPHYAALCVVGSVQMIWEQWLAGRLTESPEDILKKSLAFFLGALL